MTTVVSLINMKGGVGKSTLAFNLAWFAAFKKNLKVLAVDLDPQSNLSQYFLGARAYLKYLEDDGLTVYEIFEQFSSPSKSFGGPAPIDPTKVIREVQNWSDGSCLHLLPSRLELAWTLKNPTEKSHLLPKFLAEVASGYDLVLIDCAPTESILTAAAYRSSRYLVVPVKPEFLATIGLPLIARSLAEFKMSHSDQELEIAGVVFNDLRRTGVPPEQTQSKKDVEKLAKSNGWHVFKEFAHHSDSYPTGSRAGKPIFQTDYAREKVIKEFSGVANAILKKVGF